MVLKVSARHSKEVTQLSRRIFERVASAISTFRFSWSKLVAILVATGIIIAPLTAGTSTALARFPQSYGPNQGSPSSSKTTSAPLQVKEYNISTVRVEQLVLKAFGPSLGAKIISRMLYRVIKPLAVDYHLKYTNANSPNWAGYIVDNSNNGILPVNGSASVFNVSPVCSTCTDTATWVGVGGQNGAKYLAQTGIDQLYLKSWYEFWPNSPHYLFPLHSGDQMTGTVQYDTTNGLWFIYIGDTTTGTYYSNEFSFNPDQTTAEGSVEVQPNGPVPSFSPVNFPNYSWQDNHGYWQPLTSPKVGTLWDECLVSPVSGYAGPGSITSGSGGNTSDFSIYDYCP